MTKIQRKNHITILKEAFIPDFKKVNVIRQYLDDAYTKETTMDVNDQGGMTKSISFGVKQNGEVVNYISGDELLLRLDNRYNNVMRNKEDRIKFLKRIIIDWANNKISYNGVLSVNSID